MQWVMIHRDHAKQMIIGFGDGLAGPVAVDIADDEVLKTSSERSLVNSHE
jgi:hypothetical protein